MTGERAATYPSDLSDERWALIEPIVTAWRAERAAAGIGIKAAVHPLREIVNAILYINRTGAPWSYLPADFPLREVPSSPNGSSSHSVHINLPEKAQMFLR